MSTPSQVPTGRIAQMRQAFVMTKQADPRIGWILAATFIVTAVVAAAGSILIMGTGWISITITVIFTLLTAFLVTTIVFGRRAEKAMYAQAEGQPGAGAGVLQMLPKSWSSKPAVGFNKQQDIVHRAIGRAGIVLIGEGGSHARVASLLNTEAKKHQRIVGEEIPVTTIIVGRGEGETPLPKLVKQVKKLPKAIKPAEQTEVLLKIKALDAMRPSVPMPRGPMPTSMKGARKMMRG